MTSQKHIIALLLFTFTVPLFAEHGTYNRGAMGNNNSGMGGNNSNGGNNNNGNNFNNGNNNNNGNYNNGGQMGGGGFGGGGGGGMGAEFKEAHNKFSATSDKETSSDKSTKAIKESDKNLVAWAKSGLESVIQTIKDAPKDVDLSKSPLTTFEDFYAKLSASNSAKINAQGDVMVDGIAKASAIQQQTVYAVKLPGANDPNTPPAAAAAAGIAEAEKKNLALNGEKFSGITQTKINSTATTAENRAAAQAALASASTGASPLDAAPRGYRSPTKTEMRGILK